MDEYPPQEPGIPPSEPPKVPPSNAEKPPEPPPTMPSWEHTDQYGFFGALIRTIAEVLFHPETTFRNLKVVGGIGQPFLFGWLLQTICSLISWYQTRKMLFQSLETFMPRMGHFHPDFSFFPSLIFLIPVGVAIGLFIWTAILHLCLMITGGTNRNMETTFRVTAYSSGATAIWTIIPMVGSFVSIVWQIICLAIGLKEAHQTTYGRAILAMLLPFLVCCGLATMMMSVFIGKLL
jgi:hypothetical protein